VTVGYVSLLHYDISVMIGFVSLQNFNDGWFLVSVLFCYKISITVLFFFITRFQ